MSRMYRQFGLLLLLAGGTAGSALAQSASGGYGPGPASEQSEGGRHHWGHGGQRMLTQETLEGPPAPALLHDSIGLSGDQLDRYSQQYSNYMAKTGSSRDSLRTGLRAMRDAFESGDRSQAQGQRDALRKQSQQLVQQDKEFEKLLKQDLTKDQQKKYDQWKSAWEKAAKQRYHESR